jgi:hypothetical protein
MVSIIGEKNLIFDQLYRSIGLRFFFLMTTIDLIDVFCRQSIIGIDPIDVFLTIGAQLWYTVIDRSVLTWRKRTYSILVPDKWTVDSDE